MTLLEAAQLGADWMQVWLDSNKCDCEDSHICGRRERERELINMKATIATHEARNALQQDQNAGSERYSDSQRLDFILRYMKIEDVGDDIFCLGISMRAEKLEYDLSFGKNIDGLAPCLCFSWHDDLREVIDRAIANHGINE